MSPDLKLHEGILLIYTESNIWLCNVKINPQKIVNQLLLTLFVLAGDLRSYQSLQKLQAVVYSDISSINPQYCVSTAPDSRQVSSSAPKWPKRYYCSFKAASHFFGVEATSSVGINIPKCCIFIFVQDLKFKLLIKWPLFCRINSIIIFYVQCNAAIFLHVTFQIVQTWTFFTFNQHAGKRLSARESDNQTDPILGELQHNSQHTLRNWWASCQVFSCWLSRLLLPLLHPDSFWLPGIYCKGTFDMFVCWPHSSPGNVSVPCPSYLPWISKGTVMFYHFTSTIEEWRHTKMSFQMSFRTDNKKTCK